jgi:hypothetical protein
MHMNVKYVKMIKEPKTGRMDREIIATFEPELMLGIKNDAMQIETPSGVSKKLKLSFGNRRLSLSMSEKSPTMFEITTAA